MRLIDHVQQTSLESINRQLVSNLLAKCLRQTSKDLFKSPLPPRCSHPKCVAEHMRPLGSDRDVLWHGTWSEPFTEKTRRSWRARKRNDDPLAGLRSQQRSKLLMLQSTFCPQVSLQTAEKFHQLLPPGFPPQPAAAWEPPWSRSPSCWGLRAVVCWAHVKGCV